ncbi:MAG TPA: hypothetical protein DCS82_01835 [Rhodospirillaceae bacterium]|nr:hypothetical protein [Rhodospirillaceae bacterium]HAT34432.1 hypothetical protein [Rhodospirillaceae bacterium]|tara:strand:- start:397 stop:603 length:207 start_codon:yes stop_codon:yes gene_type:complete
MTVFDRFRRRPVKGHDLPGPRFTRWAWIYFGFYIALPILALGLALDIVLYVLFERWFDSCYALLCLFE